MQALILAGGSGTRFWPLSRRSRPKHLLALEGERSLLQDTVARLEPLVSAGSVWVCTTARLRDAIREQLPEVPADHLLIEPEGRNTAAAIGYGVRSMPAELRRGVIAVLPADHRLGDRAAFRRTLERAAEVAAREDRIMTLGVVPSRAETGYGYLELGPPLDGPPGLCRVARFVEKPDRETAERYLATGGHLWNAGMFVFRGETLLRALARHQPELAAGLEAIARAPQRTDELYPTLPATSIDYGVMEHLDDLATLPLDCGWSDLGSWQALAEALLADGEGDGEGNVRRGDVVTHDARDNLLIADRGTIAAIGVEGLVVVRTGDTVLVVPRERSQEVREAVRALAAARRDELL